MSRYSYTITDERTVHSYCIYAHFGRYITNYINTHSHTHTEREGETFVETVWKIFLVTPPRGSQIQSDS